MAVMSAIYLVLLSNVARTRQDAIFETVSHWSRFRELAEQMRIIADYSYAWESWYGDDGRLLWVNPSVERITGYSETECYRMPDYPIEIIHPDDRDKVAAVIEESQRSGNQGSFECRILRKDGSTRWTAADWQPALDSNGEPAGVRVSVRDITDNVELRKQLEEKASTDPLTGLINRRRFFEICEAEIYRSARFGRPVSLAIFDLDRFKRINDTHGHHVGDLCLRAFVGAIRANIRQTDALARFGGEEFTLLMPETDLDAATALCDRLREAVSRATVTTTTATIRFTVSAGVTVCDRTENTIDPALSRADTALYAAKNHGRNRVKAVLPPRLANGDSPGAGRQSSRNVSAGAA
jgi:diguanylate cyclase (GGDEF)-like protein/PAS domain S-box-containing protein